MRNQRSNNKTWLMPVLFGVSASLACVWGYQLETTDHIDVGNVFMILLFLGLSAVIAILVKYSWKVLEEKQKKEKSGVTVITAARSLRLSAVKKGYTRDEFFRTWMAIAACNFVVLLL